MNIDAYFFVGQGIGMFAFFVAMRLVVDVIKVDLHDDSDAGPALALLFTVLIGMPIAIWRFG